RLLPAGADVAQTALLLLTACCNNEFSIFIALSADCCCANDIRQSLRVIYETVAGADVYLSLFLYDAINVRYDTIPV
ncbi:hypothetical protein, partial [Pantoea eucrina]|uniref:hypothetical protein n=1 Tax=Pantoea eucrina TaxID=472693 RepID=UPI001B80B2D9